MDKRLSNVVEAIKEANRPFRERLELMKESAATLTAEMSETRSSWPDLPDLGQSIAVGRQAERRALAAEIAREMARMQSEVPAEANAVDEAPQGWTVQISADWQVYTFPGEKTPIKVNENVAGLIQLLFKQGPMKVGQIRTELRKTREWSPRHWCQRRDAHSDLIVHTDGLWRVDREIFRSPIMRKPLDDKPC